MTNPGNAQHSEALAERELILAENARLHRDLAREYDRIHPHMRNSYEQFLQRRDLLRMTRPASNKTLSVLELGAGTGNLTMQFLARGCRVTAVDMSLEMLSELRRKVQANALESRCELREADVDTFLSSDSRAGFDIIAMSSVAHHLPDYHAALERLADRLAPGGYLYLIHEPAHRDELRSSAVRMRRVWSLLPRGLDRVLRQFKPGRAAAADHWKGQDTRYADYHYHRNGISVADLGAMFDPRGLRLIDASRYNAHETSVVSWLDNYWCALLRYEQFQRTYFRAIWQRVR